MGTPHQGGSGVAFGKLMVNIASVFVAADDRLLRHLEENSEWLQQQLGQYGPVSGDFVTKFAFEEYPTPTVLGGSIMVVPRASAVVPGAADAEPIIIHADHINMVKFASNSDEGYRKVSGHIKMMVADASIVIGPRWETEGRVNAARINDTTETFTVNFSIPEVPETGCFAGREEEITQMSEHIQSGRHRKTIVLHGLSGIGKTQLAATYARRYRSRYSAVFWLNSKDSDTLKQSFLNAAERILHDHPSLNNLRTICKTGNLDEAVEAVERWLSNAKNTDWLLVYDNYDSPKLPGDNKPHSFSIASFLPGAEHGVVIITTISSQLRIGHQISVKKFHDIRQSLQVLSFMSRRDNLDNDPDACELARELDGLPLALATAGAYLDQVATSFADYLRNYREKWLRLQMKTPQLISYDRTLYTTWDLSLDHVRQQNPASVILLQLWAYFDNQDLWLELLEDHSGKVPDSLLAITEDQISFDDAMRALCCYALVERNVVTNHGMESRGYSMHSCVHSWTIHVLNREWNSEMAKLAVTCVGQHVPSRKTPKYWAIQQRLIRHANRSFDIVKKEVEIWANDESMFEQIESITKLYKDTSRLSKAEELLKLVLYAKTKSPKFGADHTSTLRTATSLAHVYRKQEKFEESERTYLQALQGFQSSSPGGDPSISQDILEINDRLGIVYWKQKKLDQSGAMFVQALQEKENKLGKDSEETLNTVNNFGLLLIEQGKLEEAEKLLQRVRGGYEGMFGIENILTLSAVNNLGFLCILQEKLDQAEKLLEQALKGYEKVCTGEEIPLLDAVENLGDLYRKQGRLEEAGKMYQRVLAGYKASFGSSHKRYRKISETVVALKNSQKSIMFVQRDE
ncbi:hypothetical protein N7471_010304 [Penicillium samsonianum]|uniref:uncharacterized protein n=1 Tax=Penicillium samsonianum TaxID=1882272 RepID=UPI00254911C5|nr:uncharacterized protein N7471_010304 [Penicillium samsonianum]KAJ6125811.1 hypothetical protein N7471_010304 [Penicillium samsonianum]